MTTQDLRLIAAYIQAKNDHDARALADCFAGNGSVHDTGQNESHTGRTAIAAWADKIFQAYTLTTTPTSLCDTDGKIVLIGLVSGEFPGSPREFTHSFACTDGKITDLSIG